jgi:glycosyltransferase involved in cell wall biosynthesis
MNYSVIIPHHNIPSMLERAIKSVPLRDDVEIIVVDDASDEKYVSEIKRICELRKSQIKLILLAENGGGGKARNKGLEVAEGKFAVFLDADDFFNYCIDEIMDDYMHDDAEIIYFKAGSIDNDYYLPSNRTFRTNDLVDAMLCKMHNSDNNIRLNHDVPWAKFISRKLIAEHNIKFEEIRKHNDVRFSYTSGFYAKTIKCDPRAICCITFRMNSVSMDVSAEARLLRVNVTADFIKFKKEHGIEIGDEAFLFDTMAEIYFKDKSVYNNGIKKINGIGLPQDFVSKRLRKAILNYRVRHLLNKKIRKVIKSFLFIK